MVACPRRSRRAPQGHDASCRTMRRRPSVVLTWGRVEPGEWVLSQGVGGARLRRLLCAPEFPKVVRRLLSGARVQGVVRERLGSARDCARVVVCLAVGREILDLFHNSSSGYRAQYYRGPACGDAANDFVLEMLGAQVPALLRSLPGWEAAIEWAQASMRAPGAKVWIHQGLWLRHAKREDRVLRVPRWQTPRSECPRCCKLAQWGMLAPAPMGVGLLELKGGFLDKDGRAVGTKKPQRALELHSLGFT